MIPAPCLLPECVSEKRKQITSDSCCCTLHFEPHGSHMKDTNLLRVWNSSGADRRHVAVEGHLQSVAVGSIIKKTTEEAPTGTGLHLVPVK